MNATDALRNVLALFSSHPLLERLFFASIELAVLAALVFGAIHVGRLRSPRLAALLWLMVLAKPVATLAIGSPLPLFRMEVPLTTIAAQAAVDVVERTNLQASLQHPFAIEFPSPSRTGDAEGNFAGLLPQSGHGATSKPTSRQVEPATAALPAQSAGPPLARHASTIVLTIWLAGAAFLAGLSLFDRLRIRRIVLTAKRPDSRLSDRYRAIVSELGLKRPLNLRISAALESPALVGSMFSTILMPAWLAAEPNDAKVGWALRHELMHWKLRDPLAGLIRELAHVLFYFHPVAWWAGRQWKAAAERACDRAIVTDDADSLDYAEQLYRILVGIRDRNRVPLRSGLFATRTQIGQRIAALLNGPHSSRPHLSALALGGITVLTAATLCVGGAFADKKFKGDDATASAAVGTKSTDTHVAEAPRPAARGTNAEMGAAADAEYHYAGTVVDDRGKPVAGAQISLDYWRKSLPAGGVPALTVSDAQGRFQFSRRKSDYSDAMLQDAPLPSMLIATKEGYGLAGAASIPFETTGRARADLPERQRRRRDAEKTTNVLKLASDDVPVHGRILDTEGRPVSGANVEAINVWAGGGLGTGTGAGTDGNLDAWEAATKERGADYWAFRRHIRPLTFSNVLIGPRPAVVPAVHTDAAGWFTLKGLGRERMADLVVSGPAIETMLLHVRSRSGNVIKLRREARGPLGRKGSEESFYPCDFTCVAGPSVPVEGRVIDSKSKRPIAGVIVSADRVGIEPPGGSLPGQYIWTTTDADGRYQLRGLPLGDTSLGATPPVGSRYLQVQIELTTRLSPNPLVADIQLTAGTLVRGRVTDGRTGMPVSGSFAYFALLSNPHLKEAPGFEKRSVIFSPEYHHRSDKNGAFEIPVLPGQGILAFRADNSRAFPLGTGAERIEGSKQQMPDNTFFKTAPTYCATRQFHLLTPLDPDPGAESLTVDLTVSSGLSVKGKLLAADGKPLSDYYIFGEDGNSSWYWHEGESFEIEGYSPTEHRRLMFYHPGTNLVGVHELTGEPNGMLEIKLQPGATIVGRVLDADGQPLENAEIMDAPKQMMLPEKLATIARHGVLLTYLQLEGRRITTDKQGRFELPGVIPGLKYSAGVAEGRRFLGAIFTDVTAEPGETKQLGDLRYTRP